MWEAMAADSGPWAGWALFIALASYISRSIIRGRLIPLRSHERELANKQAEVDRLTAALDKTESQRDRLLGLAEVTVSVMRALPSAPAAQNRDPVP